MIATLGFAPDTQTGEYRAIPELSATDRVVLAANMLEQGQCRNGLIEILEARNTIQQTPNPS